MDELLLHNLSDKILVNILELSEEERISYYQELIEKFYSHLDKNSVQYGALLRAYHSSFELENLYRTNEIFQDSFTAVYTRTGLIRETINDLYYNPDDLITH